MRVSIALGISMFVAVAAVAANEVGSMEVPPVAVERPAGTPRAEQGSLRWDARYSPPRERARLQASVDRGGPRALELVGGDGIALSLADLAPGLHFVELTMERRGGRTTRFTDEVLAGPWQDTHERGCDLGLTLSAQGLQQLLLPVVEAKLLAGARGNDYFGKTSVLRRRELSVVDGGLQFSVFLDTTERDKGDLSVSGVIEVKAQGDAGITASLRRLDRAAPGPKLEALARSEGGRRLGAIGVTVGGGLAAAAGGGALVGVLAAAGGGLLGAEIGEEIGERTAKKEVRKQARVQIERALRVATDALRLPDDVVVLPTAPALRADLRWCEEPTLTAEAGLRARLRMVLRDDEVGSMAAERTVFLDTPVPEPGVVARPDANLHVDVSGDLLNRLLAEWVVRGGLQHRLDDSGLRDELQASLGDRTRWQVQALGAELPPTLRLGADGGIDATVGGIAIELHDPARARARTVMVGMTGELELVPQVADAPGRVRLAGSLDAVYLGCRERDGEVERRVPCFASVVDPLVLRELLDEQLRARSDRLPVLDLGSLLALEIFGETDPRSLEVEALWVAAAQGRLSVDARVR